MYIYIYDVLYCLLDVVARRRLRASQSQIVQVTKAARVKRVEFESVLFAWVLTDTVTNNDQRRRERAKQDAASSGADRGLSANTRRILQLQANQRMRTRDGYRDRDRDRDEDPRQPATMLSSQPQTVYTNAERLQAWSENR